MDLPVVPPLKPMLAKAAREVPEGAFLYEPKWDGFRCLVFRDRDEVVLGSRNERPLERYFPELLDPIRAQLPERCVLDGELVIPSNNGLDFQLLGQRIHPAESRVAMLSEATPAHLVLFDILALDRLDLRELPFEQRRVTLEQLFEEITSPLHLTPATTDHALAGEWFARFDGAGFDGVMAKPLDGTYQSDKRVQIKVKHHRSVDCVVAGYSEHKSGGVGSLKLGLYDGGVDGGAPRLHHVGVCSAFSAAQRRTLAAELKPLEEGAEIDHPWRPDAPTAQGGAGMVRVPGMPNRWSGGRDSADWIPLRCERVVEVTCENVSGGRFRHPARFVRWRPDKSPEDCLIDQLQEAPPHELLEIFGRP
jgi:ATP-dependent DNA ligase